MGLLTPADWKAYWIAQRAPSGDVSLGKWIWDPDTIVDNGRAFLRRTFTVDAGARIATAVIRITADNVMTLYVNGKRIGDHHAWETLAEYDIAQSLRPGRNVLAVEALNEDGPCGMVAGLTITYEGGKRDAVLTDDQWRASADAQGDWTAPDYEDAAWVKAKVVGNYGDAPWSTGAGSGPKRSLYVRKEFQARAAVKHATAYVTGLGLYELSINGKRVSEEYFTPGWTQYNKRVQYRAYDVTTLLTKGANAIGAVLGNGWWSGGMAAGTSNYSPADLRLLLQLEIDYADGRHDTVVTDGTWKLHDSPIVEDTFYHGETYDARLEMPGWDKAGFDDKDWQTASIYDAPLTTLFAQRGPAIREVAEFAPVAVTQPAKGVYVYDFGQNCSGVCRLKVRGPSGTRVQTRFAEVPKPDGNIYTENYRSARATDAYLLRGGGEEVWQPRFTYRGFRYAELTGFPGEPTKDALTSVAINSAPPVIGDFKCSDDLLNRVWRNILWGQRSNMESVPTDCPQRDERLGWTGDAEAFAPTACWNMDMAGFFEKWVRDLADSQAPDGAVPDVAPTPSPNAGAPAWADAIVIVPWTLYNFYGDTGVIEDNYNAMVAWVEYMHRRTPNNLCDREGYGDWVAPVGSPSRPIGAAYYYWSTRLLGRMAAAIGKQDDARKYGSLADEIADAFNNAYLDKKTSNYPGGTQTANLMPLAFGIVPDDRRAAVAENIAKDAKSRDYHLSTGFLGTAQILPMLTELGWHDVAGRVAIQRTYPSWGYMVDKGATTIWELWNSDTAGPGMNSRNHFALGSVGEWYYEALAGLHTDPRAPGFQRILVRPAPCADVTWAEAGFHSVYGPVRSAWRIAKGDFVLRLTVPANTTAEVSVPMGQGARVLEGGRPVEKAPGVKSAGLTRTPFGAEGGGTRPIAVLLVGSGAYEFTVPGYAPGTSP